MNLEFMVTKVALPTRDHTQSWRAQALCASVGGESFFPEVELGMAHSGNYIDGRRMCAACPVQPDCLEECMTIEGNAAVRFGLFGGLSPKDRTQLARRQNREAQARREGRTGEAVNDKQA